MKQKQYARDKLLIEQCHQNKMPRKTDILLIWIESLFSKFIDGGRIDSQPFYIGYKSRNHHKSRDGSDGGKWFCAAK
ncbi:hypothetical protein [Nitrosomonas mobilis]|uniref:hypothetical protein n=1 Tax=Nitrosomonas mobilis TaxID=51642 RepID=UPI00115FD953|nr:hypothetical protein [Nitrosomonas mobilis]